MTEQEKEKMAADIKDAIRQLEGLKEHCESMVDKDDPEGIWRDDVKALRYGIAALKILTK